MLMLFVLHCIAKDYEGVPCAQETENRNVLSY